MCSTIENSVIEFGTEVATRQVFDEALKGFMCSSNQARDQHVYIDVFPHPYHRLLDDESTGRIGHMAWSEFPGYGCAGVIFHDVYLAPEYRGKGLGSALLAARLMAVSRAGYKTVFATVRVDNDHELKLLANQGFKEIAELPGANKDVPVKLLLRVLG